MFGEVKREKRVAMLENRVDESRSGVGSAKSIPTSWRPRFGIRGMLLLMLIANVLAAGIYYLARAAQGSGESHIIFLVLILGGPPALLVSASLGYHVLRFWSRRNKT